MSDFKIDNNEGPATLLSGGDFVLTPPLEPIVENKPAEQIVDKGAAEEKTPEKAPEAVEKTATTEEHAKPEIPIQEVKLDFTALLGEATKGAIKTPEELNQVLEQYNKLREDSQKPKYKSPQEEKIAQFLAEYPGQDFGISFQMYLKLNSMDVKSLDPASAIKEAMILDNMKLGLTPAKAEQLAEREIERKYADDEDGLFKERDSIQAKQKLEALQQESKAPTANPQQEAERLQQEAYNEKAKQIRDIYLSKTKEIFTKTPEPIKIKVSDDPKEELTLKAYDAKDKAGNRINPTDLRHLVENYDQEVINGRYGIKNEKGEIIGYDPQLVARDLEKIFSFEQRIKEAVEHGIHIGTERYIKERANNKPPAPNSNAGNGVAPAKHGEFIFQKPN